MNIDLNLFRVFYAVGKNLNMTKTAEELYISQPAVSQALKRLENMLNVKLFEKSSKGIILTEAGKVIYEHSKKICQLDTATTELVKQIENKQNAVLKIGVPTHIGTFYFPRFIAAFNKKYPKVKIEVINKRSEEMIDMLKNRKLDIVIDTDMMDIEDNDTVNKLKLLELEGCFVCSPKFYNFKTNQMIPANELTKYPLLLPSKKTHNRKVIDYVFQKQGVLITPLIDINSSSISKEIISRGVGIGWMIREFVQDDIDSGKLVEIKTNVSPVMTSLDVAYHKKFISDSTREFIKILKSYSERK